MPIYEYRCQACGEQFDKLIRSLSQIPPEIACPACQSTQTQRMQYISVAQVAVVRKRQPPPHPPSRRSLAVKNSKPRRRKKPGCAIRRYPASDRRPRIADSARQSGRLLHQR